MSSQGAAPPGLRTLQNRREGGDAGSGCTEAQPKGPMSQGGQTRGWSRHQPGLVLAPRQNLLARGNVAANRVGAPCGRGWGGGPWPPRGQSPATALRPSCARAVKAESQGASRSHLGGIGGSSLRACPASSPCGSLRPRPWLSEASGGRGRGACGGARARPRGRAPQGRALFCGAREARAGAVAALPHGASRAARQGPDPRPRPRPACPSEPSCPGSPRWSPGTRGG